ncbi:hypothetical protein LTR17_017652 [Elasticomyces elasticus]|nr:hypothetical protein LTR17_017652 [Elasticomyces elasticus]
MLWDPQLFLTITLGFGRFTFAQAKALDFAWDLVVGSGGQALVIILVYPLFRRMLLAHMEDRPVSIQAYTSIAFNGIAMASLWTVFRSSLSHSAGRAARPVRQRCSIFPVWRTIRQGFFWTGTLFVFAYLLAFGKLLSLMTGYQAIAGAVITPEGSTNLLNVSNSILQPRWFVVQDGSRVGLQDRSLVKQDDPNQEVLSNYDIYAHLTNAVAACESCFGPDCPLQSNPPFVFFPPPPGAPGPLPCWSNITLNLTGTLHTTMLSTPLEIKGRQTGSPDDYIATVGVDQVVMPLSYLRENTKCLPTADYEWGFSSLLLFTFCLASILFLIVLQSMAWLVYNHSRSDRLQHPINVYQDAFDIVQELKDHYGEEVDTAGIKEKVRKEGASMSLDLDGLPQSRHTEVATERQRVGRRNGKGISALSQFRRRRDSKGLSGAASTNRAGRDLFGGLLAAEETVALRPIFNRQMSSMTEVAADGADSETHTGGDDAQQVQSSKQPAEIPYTRLSVYMGT